MSSKEISPAPKFSLDEYQAQVVATRRDDHNDDWREVFPELLTSESLELMSQHGLAFSQLMPPDLNKIIDHEAIAERDTELEAGMAEEFGDMLWFATSALDYDGKKLQTACETALTAYGIEPADFQDFADLDVAVMQNPRKIKVRSDFSFSGFESDEEDMYTRVEEDPLYVLLRSGRRLIRAIEQGKKDVSPSTYIKEPVLELPQAVGEFVFVLTYIANNRLGVSIGEVASRNIEKLKSRALASS